MKVFVHNYRVRENLEHLIKVTHQQKGEPKKLFIPLIINKKTGFLFSSDSDKTEQDESIAVELQERRGRFIAQGSNNMEFSSSALSPYAFAVLRDTLNALNTFLNQLPSQTDLNFVLKELAELEIDQSFLKEEGFKDEEIDLIVEGWYGVDRLESETLLLGQNEGVYLIRKDAFATMLEEGLSVYCLTISAVASRNKIVDYTLVRKDDGWLVYNDDPSLYGPCYPSLNLLLEALGLKSPLTPK